ncbi:hypothetical protein LXA43DRAFT_969096 [Ganoderma leucocontextum]|nr:hypothetical protein LXA43DRAFT_969096 [Ganoderma leucocontextum]
MSESRSSFSLEDLLNEPFGPFPEVCALTPRVSSTTLKNPLVLKCVLLEARPGVITGLDECESCQPGHDVERFNDGLPVLFTGILGIDNPSWLTSQAISTIEKTLRERDYNARLAIDPQARRRDITLDFVYKSIARSSKKVQVIIQGIKFQTVSFMQSRDVPNGLQLASSLKNQPNPERSTSSHPIRRYKVSSLHIATYERSRCYLRRWRLFSQLQELLALDAGPGKSFRDNKTPLAERTPEWFVELYIRHKAYANEQCRYRIHYDSDSDSDIESGANGALKPGLYRVPRRVPRAEIRIQLERDGEWIKGQVGLRTQGKWLDMGVWADWLASMRPTWQPDVLETEYNSSDSNVKMENSLHAPKGNPRRRAPKPNTAEPIISRPYSPVVNPDDGLEVDETMLRTYDPDFSPASTTLGSPVSSPSRTSTPVDPDLLASLPAELWHPPNVNALLIWTCPWNGCSHMIDLLHPTDEDMDHPAIPEDGKRRFQSQDASWDGSDVWARDAFGYMADKHHFWHLDQAGIDVEAIGGRYSFRWRHPSSHPRSSQFRRVRIDDREPRPETIKQEDM